MTQHELDQPDMPGFINQITKEYVLYKPDIIQLLTTYRLSLYVPYIEECNMYRWYPEEIVNLILKVDNSIKPVHTAPKNSIPFFLLKNPPTP